MAKMNIRECFGLPQILAAVLLVALFAQCAWFIAYYPLTQIEATNVRAGLDYLAGRAPASEMSRTPLVALSASLPLRILSPEVRERQYDQFFLDRHRWLIRLPFVFSGLLLGASLWYVSRRLYGNTGGYIALLLYAFNPAVVAHMSSAEPGIVAAWGAFGAVFTAIAVAHTLYAPREVVLWNWRRIMLLGFCIFLMVGAHFGTVWLLLLALVFMMWAVPHRRAAALAIWASACGVSVLFLLAAYLFRVGEMFRSVGGAHWFPVTTAAITQGIVYRVATKFFVRETPAPTLLFVIALIVYLTWRRTRFFGNTAPLLVALLLVALGILIPASAGFFFFVALPFLMVFSAGVLTDLLESDRVTIALGVILGVLLTQAVTGIMGLAHLSRTAR